MDGFKSWLDSNSIAFPVPEDQFIDKLKEFTNSAEASPYITRSLIGLVGDRLMYVTVRAAATA